MKKIIPVIFSVLLIFSLVSIMACREGKESTTEETSQKTANKETLKQLDTELVDINSATKEELMSLQGIGEAYSKRIIEGRPYKSKVQLNSRGIIPDATYDKIADKIIAKQAK